MAASCKSRDPENISFGSPLKTCRAIGSEAQAQWHQSCAAWLSGMAFTNLVPLGASRSFQGKHATSQRFTQICRLFKGRVSITIQWEDSRFFESPFSQKKEYATLLKCLTYHHRLFTNTPQLIR